MSAHAPSAAPVRPHAVQTRLPGYLALAYAALVVYASLHPFTGWRDPVLPPWVFLDAAWPRYWTGFDLAINALAFAARRLNALGRLKPQPVNQS